MAEMKALTLKPFLETQGCDVNAQVLLFFFLINKKLLRVSTEQTSPSLAPVYETLCWS